MGKFALWPDSHPPFLIDKIHKVGLVAWHFRNVPFFRAVFFSHCFLHTSNSHAFVTGILCMCGWVGVCMCVFGTDLWANLYPVAFCACGWNQLLGMTGVGGWWCGVPFPPLLGDGTMMWM